MAREAAVRVLVAGVGLVVGLALGGLGPRAENRLLRARVEALEEMPRSGRFTEGLSEMLRGARVPEPAPSRADDRPVVAEPAPDIDTAPRDDAPSEGAVVIELGDDDDRSGEGDAPFRGEEGIEAAMEAMEVRRRQAWRALQEQADPTPEQTERIEAAVDEMNEQLHSVAQEFAAVTAGGAPPQRRDVMVFAADTLETMIATEDAIYDTLGDDVAASLDDEVLDPTAYIDGSVLEVLQDIEGFE